MVFTVLYVFICWGLRKLAFASQAKNACSALQFLLRLVLQGLLGKIRARGTLLKGNGLTDPLSTGLLVMNTQCPDIAWYRYNIYAHWLLEKCKVRFKKCKVGNAFQQMLQKYKVVITFSSRSNMCSSSSSMLKHA